MPLPARPSPIRPIAPLLLVVASMCLTAQADVCEDATGPCLLPHTSVGCDDVECCGTVCAANPLCCEVQWDADCAQTADQTCAGLCGASASLDCFVPHDNPACDDAECCELVCSIDDFCCNVHWDAACAFAASLNCEPTGQFDCGDPLAGSCFEPHGNPACDDAQCCQTVCKVSPTCCDNTWDIVCANIATSNCVGFCVPDCPPGSTIEFEQCESDTNDPCYFASANPVLQPIACGAAFCGRVTQLTSPSFKPDVDVYTITLSDTNGDGITGVRLSLNAAFNGFMALLPANGCPPIAEAVAHVNGNLCLDVLSELTCVEPGAYWVVVAPGDWPNPSATGLDCGDANQYVARVLCADIDCATPCNASAGSCYEFHKTAGCADIECCTATCAVEPTCCEVQWDFVCVATAIDLCAPPPPNDTCATAQVVAEGSTQFTTLGADSEGPGVPANCNEGSDLTQHDVWFRYTPTKDALVSVSTCGAALSFDSALAVYKAGPQGCGALTLLGCDDNASGVCIPQFASKVQVGVDCGVTYYIRVGGGYGTGTLAITFVTGGPACPPPCPADLNGDGLVGAADLAILLGAWGTPGPGDLDGDSSVGPADLGILLGEWGAC